MNCSVSRQISTRSCLDKPWVEVRSAKRATNSLVGSRIKIESGKTKGTTHRQARRHPAFAPCALACDRGTSSIVNPAAANVEMNPIRESETTTPANKDAEIASNSAIHKGGP